MSKLKSNATYIYEQVDGITYAREMGDSPNKRFEIGRSLEKQTLIDDMRESKFWEEIRRAAKTNLLLQEALERVIIIYHLSEKDGEK